MRRSLFFAISMLLFVAGGLTCFVAAALNAAPGGIELAQAVGGTLLIAGGMIGVVTWLSIRRDGNRIATAVREVAAQGRDTPQSIDANDNAHQKLAFAVNELLDSTQHFVSDALLQVKELEIQLKVATSERQHVETIIHSISDAVMVTDSFDDVLLVNEAAGRVLQFNASGIMRTPVSKVLRDPKLIELITETRKSKTRHARRVIEHPITIGNQQRTFKVTLSAVADRNDEPAGVVTVLHDMTREKEVAQMKNDFVSSVSHELRTPLASVKAYVEMLIDGEAQDEKTKNEFYEVIQSEANRLSRLIDNILSISRIESGLVKTERKLQSVAVIVKEAVDVIAPQCKLKSITLNENLCPVFYQGNVDHDMLYQGVLNLLSNAVKYTPEGGSVTVTMTVDEEKRIIRTGISDTGVGIPPKDVPFVFDKFYRVESNNRMAKGTGLGLSLVKHIIEMAHQGRIFVESEVGKGSTFGFELPLSE